MTEKQARCAWTACLIVTGWAFLVGSQEVKTLSEDGQVLSEVWVGRTDRAPVIDGNLNDDCWKGVRPLTGFTYGFENWVEPVQTRVYLLYDREALYVAFDCDEPDVSGMETTAKGPMEVWQGKDDLVDIFLVVRQGRIHQGGSINYQFAVTAGGVKFDQYNGPEENLSYTYGKDCPVAVRINRSNWVCEMKLPYKALRLAPQMGQTWRINLGRARPQNAKEKKPRPIYSSWAPDSGQWKDEATYGYLKGPVIGDHYAVSSPPFVLERVCLAPPVVGGNSISVTLNSIKPDRYRFRIVSTAPSGATAEETVEKDLAAGNREYTLPYTLAAEPGEHSVVFSVGREKETVYTSAPASVALPALVTAFCDRNYYTSEKECRINASIPDIFRGRLAAVRHQLIVRLKDSAGKIVREEKRPAGPEALRQKIPVEISGLAPGKYSAEAILVESGGKTVASAKMDILKYPPAASEIKIDRERRVFLDNGKPFLPLHWYFGPEDPEAAVRELARMGFNHLFLFDVGRYWKPSGDGDTSHIRKLLSLLDEAQKNNVKVTVWWETPTRHSFVGFSYYWRPEKLEHLEAMIPDFEKVVLALKDHPALFGYHLLDEPGDSRQERTTHKRLLEVLRRHDPYHPAWVSFCRIVRMLPRDDPAEVYDAAGAHLYWNPVWPDNIAAISMWVDMGVQALEPWRIPYVATMQSGMPSVSVREPTAGELRQDMYLAVIHGTTAAFGYYYYDNYLFGLPTHGKSHEEMAVLNRELTALFPIFSEPDPPQEIVRSDTSRPIHVSIERHDGKTYLFVANTGGTSHRVRFEGNFLSGATSVREFFRGTRIPVAKNAFTDVIPFQGTRVYEISQARPGPAAEEKLVLRLSSAVLADTVDVPGYFRKPSGAYYLAGQRALCVYGKGNTLESVARAVNNPAIFSYDPGTRTAACAAEKIRICCGGELIIGKQGKPAESETLKMPENPRSYDYILCNGVVRVYDSRIEAKRGLLWLMNIGRCVLVNAELSGFDTGHPWHKEAVKNAKADAAGRLTGESWAGRVDEQGLKTAREIVELNFQ